MVPAGLVFLKHQRMLSYLTSHSPWSVRIFSKRIRPDRDCCATCSSKRLPQKKLESPVAAAKYSFMLFSIWFLSQPADQAKFGAQLQYSESELACKYPSGFFQCQACSMASPSPPQLAWA